MPVAADDPFEDDGGIITELHWFSQHNGAKQWLVWTTDNGELRAFDGSLVAASQPWRNLRDANDRQYDGSQRSRYHNPSPWQGQIAQSWSGRLYMANGYNEVIVFDGDKVERAGFSGIPQSPTGHPLEEEFATTLNDLGVGSVGKVSGYKYLVTFLNERGQESMPSFPSDSIIVDRSSLEAGTDADSRVFIVVQIPKGPEECVARRIYRTQDILTTSGEPLSLGLGDIFYYHSEIQDNILTSFEDGVPDASLGSALDRYSLGPIPPGTKFLASFKDTMFAAGAAPNEVSFSRPLHPEVFPPDNVIQIGDDDTSPITGMYPTQNALVVFKAKGVYLVKGDPSSGFRAQTFTRDIGCIAPRTIVEVPGAGLVFMGIEGIYAIKGGLNEGGVETAIHDISIPIRDYLDTVNMSAAVGARGCIYHKDKEYWLAVPTLGSHKNNKVFVFHYSIGQWSIREDYPIQCMVETRDHRGYLFFGSHDEDKLGIHVYSHGWEDKDGDPITPVWESVHHDFGSVYNAFQPAHVMAYAVAYGNNALSMDYRINRSVEDVRSAPVTRPQQDPGDELSVYGTAKWGQGNWGFFRPTVIRYDISTRDKARTRELQVCFSADRRIQIVGYDLEVQIGEQKNIRPLNTAFNPGRRG